jgi:hypothetical protein
MLFEERNCVRDRFEFIADFFVGRGGFNVDLKDLQETQITIKKNK